MYYVTRGVRVKAYRWDGNVNIRIIGSAHYIGLYGYNRSWKRHSHKRWHRLQKCRPSSLLTAINHALQNTLVGILDLVAMLAYYTQDTLWCIKVNVFSTSKRIMKLELRVLL